jgi:uroporphyrinogen decarboxylase
MLAPAYRRLKAHVGFESDDKLLSRTLQYAQIDEEILLRLGSDGRPLAPGPAPGALRRELSANALADEWGITWEMRPGTLYYEVVDAPFREASVDDIAAWCWPDLAHADRFQGLADRARDIRARGYAVVAMSGVDPWEQYCLLRGMDRALMDLILEEEFFHALFGHVCDLMLAGALGLLHEAGEYLDVLVVSDDLGTQNAPMMSPAMYRRLIKPYHAEVIAKIRENSAARIFFHSDGNIYPLIEDFIEIGVDILNPVQVSAQGMGDTARLKREFGDRLCFCGAIDTQHALPRGTPEDVRREVRRRVADLGPGGGYICAPVHCIQPDVPPENVCTMLAEIRVAGAYPLPPFDPEDRAR